MEEKQKNKKKDINEYLRRGYFGGQAQFAYKEIVNGIKDKVMTGIRYWGEDNV